MAPIQGIYYQIDAKKRESDRLVEQINSDTLSPAAHHAAQQQAPRLLREAAALLDHAIANEREIQRIEELLDEMSKVKSPARELVMRCLEEGSMRLRRELGDKPDA